MGGLETDRTAQVIIAGHALMQRPAAVHAGHDHHRTIRRGGQDAGASP